MNFTHENTWNLTNTYGHLQYGHSLDRLFSIVISIYFISIIIGGVLFNGILIYVITQGKNRRTPGDTFMVNLAICDIITAVSTVSFDADFLLRGYYSYGTFICGLKETACLLALPSSIVNLLLLTVDRFFKITYPYKYMAIFTRRNVIWMLCVSWVYYLVVALFPVIYNGKAVIVKEGRCHVTFPNSYMFFLITINFVVPVFCILTMNVLIYQTAKRHAESIRRQESSVLMCKSRRKSNQSIFSTNYKAAKTIMTLVGLFLVCWLTYIILITINIACKECFPREIVWLGNAINFSSIPLNPVLYGLLNKTIRKLVVRLLCWKKH